MQIHHLSGSTPRPWAAELNPRLTVVQGVPPEVAAPLRAAIDALVRARISGPELAAAGLGGRVVVDGVDIALEDIAERAPGLVPSTPRTHADLVGPSRALGAGRARALEAEVDAAASALAEAQADLAQVREEWASAHTARTAQVAEEWRARAEAAAALRAARRRSVDAVVAPDSAPGAPGPVTDTAEVTTVAVERLEAARAAHDAATEALAEAESRRDRALAAGRSAEAVAPLRSELEAVEHELALAPAPLMASAEERRAVTERRARIAHEIDQISLVPTDRVTRALEGAEGHGGIAAVEAAQVAVEWERVRDLVADQEAEAPTAPASSMFARRQGAETAEEAADRVRRAQERVEAARRSVTQATSSTGLDPTEVEALEAAHAEVLAAWEGSERRIGVGKARRRLEDAQMAEREILGRLGFASYTEFMMSGRAARLPSTLDLDHARRGLAEAEAELSAAEAAAAAVPSPEPAPDWDADAARGRMAATLDALRARAAVLLGEEPHPDVAAHLRDRIATDPVSDLRLALDEVGLPLGEVLSRDEVLARARAWLAQQEGEGTRRTALAAERVEVQDHLARLDAADGARAARAALVRRRDALRAEVEEGTVVAGAVEAAEARVVHDRDEVARAAEARDEAEDAARSVADRSATSEAAPAPADDAPVDVDLVALEAEARDAQTALDVAVAHLLPGRDADDAGDAALGRAEARVELARLELVGLEQVLASRAASGAADDDQVDVDGLIWQVLARLASQRDAAAPGGPGPTPLVLDEPFGSLDGDAVARVCDALVGPAAAVQTVLVTSRPEVGRWLEGTDAEVASLVEAHLLDADAPT